jgi:hypothetical protein
MERFEVLMIEQPQESGSGSPTTQAPYRIWVAHCLFKKNGFPSLGTFGKSEAPVVIMTVATWQKLCAEIPALQTTQFEVGANHE